MNRNYIFSTVSDALPVILGDLLHEGDEINGTKELTHVGTTLTEPWRREVLVPRRRVNLAAQIAETMWVLAGRNDIGWLAHYLPRAPDFSDNGETWRAGYGPRLRSWVDEVDQLAYVVETLQQHPSSRQAVISLWDAYVDTRPGKDIACNDLLMFSLRHGHLDLHVAIRSNDVVWGWSGINAFEWSALQEIVAHLVNAEVGSLHFSTTSLHLYEQHWDRARDMVDQESVRAAAYLQDSPRFILTETPGGPDWQMRSLATVDVLIERWFEIEGQIRNGTHHHHSDVSDFPEPMMRSWLRVIEWWWENDWSALAPLAGTRLWYATTMAVHPKDRKPFISEPMVGRATNLDEVFAADQASTLGPKIMTGGGKTIADYGPPTAANPDNSPEAFVEYVDALHRAKHADYGNSWKRRGEAGIMGNIARKVDRLGKNSEHETAVDTATDLLVYLCKYRWWLVDQGILLAPIPPISDWLGLEGGYSDVTEPVRAMLDVLSAPHRLLPSSDFALQGALTELFRQLEARSTISEQTLLKQMIQDAFDLAYRLWSQQ